MLARTWRLAARPAAVHISKASPCRNLPTVRLPVRFLTSVETSQFPLFITDTLLPKCGSCGVLLQSEDHAKPGFYVEQKKVKSFQKPEDLVHQQHMKDLSEDDKMLLLNGASASVPDAGSELSKHKTHPHSAKVQCTRCRDALFRSKFDPTQYKVDTVAEVMESVHPTANLVYVISAADFPMSLDTDVFKYRLARTMKFVVSKCDLLFSNNDVSNKHGLRFFQDYLWRVHQVLPENVFCVSGSVDWNTEKLYAELNDDSYFIGSVNSGKLTLILSLVHVAAKHKQALPNARRDRQAQKYENAAGAHAKSNRQAVLKRNLALVRNFKRENGPGTSYMPGFTRGNIAFELSRGKTIYDVPGFARSHASQLYEYMAPNAIKLLLKGQKTHKAGTYRSHYDTVKENQVVTVGGLFFLQAPPGSMLQVRNVINHKAHVFKSLDKALDVWRHPDQYPALQNTYVVSPENTELVKHIVPSFYGSVDLVIRNVGYVLLTPTGKYASEPFVVYLPRGLDAIIRQPITHYITRTLAGRDGQGNALAKKNWAAKSVTEIKRFTGKTPFLSRLVPVPQNTAVSDDQYMHDYVLAAKGKSVPHREIGEHTRYANWV